MQTFVFSKVLYFKRIGGVFLIAFALFLIMACVRLLILFTVNGDLGREATILLNGIAEIFTIPIIVFTALGFWFRNFKVLVNDEKIIVQRNNKTPHLLWKNVSRIRLIENSKKMITVIAIFQGKKKFVELMGLSDMTTLATLIKSKIPSDSIIKVKRDPVDWKPPFWMLAYLLFIGILGGVITYIVPYWFGKN